MSKTYQHRILTVFAPMGDGVGAEGERSGSGGEAEGRGEKEKGGGDEISTLIDFLVNLEVRIWKRGRTSNTGEIRVYTFVT